LNEFGRKPLNTGLREPPAPYITDHVWTCEEHGEKIERHMEGASERPII
jgi:hypothetical protein